jgi:hypothetical protein
MKKVKKRVMKPWLKNVLSALAVAIFGFILLNLTFLFDVLFQSLIDLFVSLFTQVNISMDWSWFSPFKHVLFVIVIGLISWFVFKSRLKVIYKAIYMVVPIAVVLATLGMFLYRWPMILYPLGALLCLGTLYYFYRTKQPWLYYYAVILISITLTIFTLFGGEI